MNGAHTKHTALYRLYRMLIYTHETLHARMDVLTVLYP